MSCAIADWPPPPVRCLWRVGIASKNKKYARQKMKKPTMASEVLDRPSRRSALQLFLGGYAVAMAGTGLDWSVARAQPADYSDGLPRSRPEDQGISPSAILDLLDEI